MVSVHLCSSGGEVTHFMENHCGQHVEGRAARSLGNSKLIRAEYSGKEGHVFHTQESKAGDLTPLHVQSLLT
jgi:hypothetical protein